MNPSSAERMSKSIGFAGSAFSREPTSINGQSYSFSLDTASLGETREKNTHTAGPIKVAMVGEVWPLDGAPDGGARLLSELYRRHGTELVNYCHGQFAAAIVDGQRDRVSLLVNWPGGPHALYYVKTPTALHFATRMNALLDVSKHGVAVNEHVLVELFERGGMSTHHTLLDGVKQVLPGHAVVYEGGKLYQQCVLRWPDEHRYDPADAGEFLEMYRDVIRQQIAGPGRVGAFLSGGLDSSMNVALMAEISAEPVKTFSLGFDQPDLDESAWSRLLAERFGTHHRELTLDSPECLERLPEMVWAMEQPIIDYSFIPVFCLAEAAKREVGAMVGGDGPDHLLGRRYGLAAYRRLLRSIPGASGLIRYLLAINGRHVGVRAAFWKRARRRHVGRRTWLALSAGVGSPKDVTMHLLAHWLWGPLSPNELGNLLSRSLLDRVAGHDLDAVDDFPWTASFPDAIDQLIVADASTAGLCEVFNKVGHMCTHHGLALRTPYLSLPVSRYMLKLKRSWKVRGSTKEILLSSVPEVRTKFILREAARGIVPDEVLTKPKQGFTPPLTEWLRKLYEGRSAEQIFGALVGGTDWFNVGYLDHIVAEHTSGVRDHGSLLILLATLDQWHRIYVEGSVEPPSWQWSECFA